MLAAQHNQENLVQSHPTTGKHGPRQLPPKTPLKIPLNDENAPVTGGKALLGARRNTVTKKQALATPMGTRQRPALGNKTTNAKARAGPATGGVKDKVRELEQSQAPQATAQKPRSKPVGSTSLKLEVRNDEAGERDIEYIPPRPTDIPYESDVLPDGLLTFDGLKPENLLRGYYERYHDPVDESGVRRKDRLFEERLQKALKDGDERILRDIQNTNWSMTDVTEAKRIPDEQQKLTQGAGAMPSRVATRRPATIASRRAASALSMTSATEVKKPRVPVQTRKPSPFLPGRRALRPVVPTKSQSECVGAAAASRTTLGYSKGRSASSAVQTRGTFSRTASAASAASVSSELSDTTITPANFHKTQAAKLNKAEESSRPQFLSIFNAEDDSDDDGFGRNAEINFDDDEDFQLKLSDS